MGLAGRKQSTLATDVLWSDPSADEGISTNDTRGVGLLFGPDVTKVVARNGAESAVEFVTDSPSEVWETRKACSSCGGFQSD